MSPSTYLPMPRTTGSVLLTLGYRLTVTTALVLAMHVGGQHAPSLRVWVWTAGALVYGRWLLARNRLALRGHEVSGQAPNRVVLNKETRKKWRHPVSTRR
ncbi:hypothetical protein SAMN04487983_11083, partial [Streptomyces sp. yr375]